MAKFDCAPTPSTLAQSKERREEEGGQIVCCKDYRPWCNSLSSFRELREFPISLSVRARYANATHESDTWVRHVLDLAIFLPHIMMLAEYTFMHSQVNHIFMKLEEMRLT